MGELEQDEYGRTIIKKTRFSGVRKIIGNNMRQSLDVAPQATITTRADVTKIKEIKQRYKNQGIHVTFSDILVKLIGQTLIECPAVNSSLKDGKYIYQYANANVGVAVGTDHGLFVPVIKDVHDRSVVDISKDLKEKVNNLREGNIKPEYFNGGTFTVSNLGMYDMDVMTPIINSPEAAILCLGAIRDTCVVIDKKIEIRPLMWLSFTLDHSVLDGTDGANFVIALKKHIEDPPECVEP